MKVLFVASGNKAVGKCSSFVQSQYDSLVAEGLDMQLYSVVGHGIKGFLKNVRALRRVIQSWQPYIIHAHYSTFGILASIAAIGIRYHHSSTHSLTHSLPHSSTPSLPHSSTHSLPHSSTHSLPHSSTPSPKILVSILGSFPTRDLKWRYVRFFIQHIWNGTLVKSERTRAQLGLDLPIVPNGVNLDIFHPMNQAECRKQVGFDTDKKYIVWCSNPARPEKNWSLAEEAVALLHSSTQPLTPSSTQLIAVFNKTPQEVATYMNAADCLLLTSWSEGSPNVIKEAMACNCPIVTTNVGDVVERLRDLDGCYVSMTEHEVISVATHELYHAEVAADLAQLLGEALSYNKRTEGCNRIQEDGLTIQLTAAKILQLYYKII